MQLRRRSLQDMPQQALRPVMLKGTHAMTAPELRPCPFCGETDVITIKEPLEKDGLAMVLCLNCYAEAPLNYENGGWNTRADLSQAAIATLERENYELREAVTALQGRLEIQQHNNSVLRTGNIQLQRDVRNATDPFGQD